MRLRLLSCLALLLSLVVPVRAAATTAAAPAATSAPADPAALPDSAPGRALAAWLAAFNAADRSALERLQAHLATPEAIDDTLALRDYTGGYDLAAVERGDERTLVVRVVTRDAMVAAERLTLELHADAPARIAAVGTETLPIPRLAQDAALAGLRARIDGLVAADEFAGAWLVARDGVVLAQGAAGPADRAGGTANALDTRFRYGSLGKMFTAVAVLQQVDAGRLALDGTVADYLPDYPNAEVGAVTLRQLLTHTGGTGGIDIFGEEFAANRSAMRTHADYLRLHGERGVGFAPGSQVDYSNYGFVLLGAIVEKVTGRDYYELVATDVLARAGMTRTGWEPESVDVPGRAVSYRRVGGAWVDARDTLPWRGMGAGGGYTTVADLLAFAGAMQRGALLSPASFALATSPQMQENWYGFGFVTVGEGGLRRWGHGGDADGMNADFRVFPESGWVLVSLSNLDPPAAYRLMRWFEPRMPLER